MISIIIPSYNYGHLIAETIKSVCNQSYTNLEVIVIDDGSVDDTETVVTGLAAQDSRIKYHKFENGGLGTSRNRGLAAATGNYVQFLDADDLLEHNKFKYQLQIFEQQPAVDVVYGSVRYFKKNPFDPNDRLLTYWGPQKEWMAKISGSGDLFVEQVFKANFAHLSSPLFKRTLTDKVGLFDNEISAVADYHYLLRCAIAGGHFFYHDTAGTYSLVRWHPDNMSRNVPMMQSEEVKMRKKLMPLLANNAVAVQSNSNAIKSLEYKLTSSWKRHFLSGGKFDFLKKWIKFIGLEKFLVEFFYKSPI